jgi:aminopeptidase C
LSCHYYQQGPPPTDAPPTESSAPTPTPIPGTSEGFTLDKGQYSQGQWIQATFSDASQLDYWDEVVVFRSDVTDYTNTPEIKSINFGQGTSDGTGVVSLRVDFIETGSFKLVVRAKDNKALILGETVPFTVVESPATLTLDKGQYSQGQSIQATFSDASQLDYWDEVVVFQSDVTDYTSTPEIKSINFGQGAGAGNDGVASLRVDYVETGSFKLVVRAKDNKALILGETVPFTVVESPATLTLDKGQYSQGQSIQATFSDASQLNYWDEVVVFRSDVTDYTSTPEIKSINFGQGAGASNDGVASLRVDYVETGSFKLVVRAKGNKALILGETVPFTVVESPATLTLDKGQYSQGQSIQATFSDASQLDYWDEVVVFRSDVTDYTSTPEIKSINFGQGASDGTGVVSLRVDFIETGSFKLVVRAKDNKALILGETVVFTVSSS